MRSLFRVSLTAALLGGVLSAQAAVLVTFDDLADGSIVGDHYAGLHFFNPIVNLSGNNDVYARSTPGAASGDNVVSVFATGAPAFDARYGAVDITLDTPVSSVSVLAAALAGPENLGTPTHRPYLQAFDSAGTLLDTVYFAGTLPSAGGFTAYETLSYTSATDDIAHVRLSSQANGSPTNPVGPFIYATFDNLTIGAVPESSTVALLCTGLAVVVLASRKGSAKETLRRAGP